MVDGGACPLDMGETMTAGGCAPIRRKADSPFTIIGLPPVQFTTIGPPPPQEVGHPATTTGESSRSHTGDNHPPVF